MKTQRVTFVAPHNDAIFEVFTLPHVFHASLHGLAWSPMESELVHTDWPGANWHGHLCNSSSESVWSLCRYAETLGLCVDTCGCATIGISHLGLCSHIHR